MNKSDLLSILVTFSVGLFAGSYLYLTNFAEIVTSATVPTAEEVLEFTVVADVYGGCRESCPSFQVTDGGSYRFLYFPEVGGEKASLEGPLPFELRRQLQKELTEEALIKQSQPSSAAGCNSYSDGVDVEYTVTIKGTEYKLDSCKTTVDLDSDLWKTLRAVWDYYETL